MKENFILCAILSGILIQPLFAGPEDTAGTPSHAVKTFYTSMAKTDFSTAKKYVQAKELVDMITSVESLSKEVPDLKKETTEQFSPFAKAKYLSEKVTGGEAEVTYSVQEKGKVKRETLRLRKIGGIWKITE